jgi:hypothetical protein
MIIGRHVSNILIFRSVVKKPNDISGQITMAHSLVLAISTFQYFVAVMPIALIAVFAPTPFGLGGLAGAILILAVHARWIQRYKKQIKASRLHKVGAGRGQ